jgi:hypothetical protein
MAGGLNKSFRNNNLMVRPPIGTPQFQVQQHYVKTINNTTSKGGGGGFDSSGATRKEV